LPIEENHQHGLHTRLLKSHFFWPWQGFSDPCSGLTCSGRIVGKTPRLIASYNLLKEVRITVCCGSQIPASCNSPVFLLWSQRVLGTTREQIFRFRKSSTTIFLTVSLPMFTSSASILRER